MKEDTHVQYYQEKKKGKFPTSEGKAIWGGGGLNKEEQRREEHHTREGKEEIKQRRVGKGYILGEGKEEVITKKKCEAIKPGERGEKL
jgi:hypothetical protein